MLRNCTTIFILVALATTGLFAQSDSASELMDRIRAMEKQAAERDARIAALQERLSEYEASDVNRSEFETLINGLLEDDGPTVDTPKSNRLKIGGQFRIRGEFRTVKNYAGGVQEDTDFVIQRTRLHFDFDVVENLRAFVQLQDSRRWGDENSPTTDLEGVDIHQAFLDFQNVFGHDWTFRVGRQELSYGDQRLVSPLDWHPVGRSWDGVRTWYTTDTFQLDAFVTNVSERSIAPDGEQDDDHVFSGIYFHYTGWENHEVDLYFFYRNFTSGTFVGEDGLFGDREEATVGLRFKGKSGGFGYSAEGVYQFGNNANDDIDAYAWALLVSYTFDSDWKPSISLEWTFASGDDDPTDGNAETFNPLYPFGHYFQGFLDIFAWRNGHDLVLRLSAKPSKDWWVQAAFHYFLLDSDRDAWYNAGGAPIRRVGGGVSNEVGAELDIHAKYNLNAATKLWFGYSHFFAGNYVEDTGDSPDTDWVYFQMTINF